MKAKIPRKRGRDADLSVSVKFALDGCGPLRLTTVYGPNSPLLRKDFWVELLDIFGLSFSL